MATTTMTTTTMTTTATTTADGRRGPRHHAGDAPYPGRPRRSRLVHSLVLVGLAATGVAVAAGAATGFVGGLASGSGTTPVGAPAPFTALARPAGDLAPGLEVPATVTVENPYDRPVVVQSLTADGARLADGDPACDPAVVGFAATVDPLAPASTVPAGGQATFTGAVTMSAAAVPACQGASFRIPVVVAVRLS